MHDRWPVVRRRFRAARRRWLEGSGDELTYNYALFNLGSAYRQAGRPEDAIPVLQQRLDYPDQTEVVQQELDAAYADAGIAPEDKPCKGPKPKKVKEE